MRRSGIEGTVVVTGATSGVGRAVAAELGRKGCSVALLARGEDGLEGAAKEVRALGGRALPIQVDVADHEAVEAAAAKAESELGPIDVWINNAMTTVFSELKDITPEQFRRATEVTYLGSVYGTMAALKRMLPRDHGAVVQVGSALAYRGIPLQSAYCGSKHALQGFMESLRCELLHDRTRVRVISVHLPGMNTPQFDHCENHLPNRSMPVPPIYQPEVAARSIVWAAQHPRRREVWVGGSTVATILANYVAPGLLDQYLARTNFKAQQRDEPKPADAPSNLFHPVAGDPGAHGSFDDKAHPRSAQALLSRHHWALPLIPAAAAGGVVGAMAVVRATR
ncbi:MAG: SDR family oxidoreductase [Actinomycetota bacterium]|nr:SDR family oxidoreductase [Actinomycetota bacterium]